MERQGLRKKVSGSPGMSDNNFATARVRQLVGGIALTVTTALVVNHLVRRGGVVSNSEVPLQRVVLRIENRSGAPMVAIRVVDKISKQVLGITDRSGQVEVSFVEPTEIEFLTRENEPLKIHTPPGYVEKRVTTYITWSDALFIAPGSFVQRIIVENPDPLH